jgi:hypothetical protein
MLNMLCFYVSFPPYLSSSFVGLIPFVCFSGFHFFLESIFCPIPVGPYIVLCAIYTDFRVDYTGFKIIAKYYPTNMSTDNDFYLCWAICLREGLSFFSGNQQFFCN